MNYLLLLWEFFKTGLFAIGGGLATLPFLGKMGETYGWFTQKELANMLAVSESTPGPIGVNMATYVGTVSAGIFGGLVATLALILPSYLIILLVSRIMNRFRENPYVLGAMKTLRPASVGMVCAAVIGVLESVLINMEAVKALQWTQMVSVPVLILFAVLLAVYLKFQKLHPIVILSVGAAAGILLQL
jgi:chromate transporter